MNRAQRRAAEKASARKPIDNRVAELETRTVAMDIGLLAQAHSALACRVLACAVALESGIPADRLIARMLALVETMEFKPIEQLAEIEATLRHATPAAEVLDPPAQGTD
jgi:hypothetical protein